MHGTYFNLRHQRKIAGWWSTKALYRDTEKKRVDQEKWWERAIAMSATKENRTF